jgi:hypothetical protein
MIKTAGLKVLHAEAFPSVITPINASARISTSAKQVQENFDQDVNTGQHIFGYPDERSDHNTGCETSNSSDCRDSRNKKNNEVNNEACCEQSDG